MGAVLWCGRIRRIQYVGMYSAAVGATSHWLGRGSHLLSHFLPPTTLLGAKSDVIFPHCLQQHCWEGVTMSPPLAGIHLAASNNTAGKRKLLMRLYSPPCSYICLPQCCWEGVALSSPPVGFPSLPPTTLLERGSDVSSHYPTSWIPLTLHVPPA